MRYYSSRSVMQILFTFHGSVFPKCLPHMIGASIAGLGAGFLFIQYGITIDTSLHETIALVLGFLLGFRAQNSVDRWWQGREVLGSMVVAIRDLARQITVMHSGEDNVSVKERAKAIRLLAAYIELIVQHVRHETNVNTVDTLSRQEKDALSSSRHPSAIVLQWLTKMFETWARKGTLDWNLYGNLDSNISRMTDAFTGLDQLASSPVPFPLVQLLYYSNLMFLYTNPFAFNSDLKWLTPLGAALVALLFVGIEKASAELEDPFGRDANDVDIDYLVAGVVHDMAFMIGQRDKNYEEMSKLLDSWVFEPESPSHIASNKHKGTTWVRRMLGKSKDQPPVSVSQKTDKGHFDPHASYKPLKES